MEKQYYCPTCHGELEMLSGCGAVGYFCNHCKLLISRKKMLLLPTIPYDHAFLLVVDMQNGLLNRDIWNKALLAENVDRLIAFAREKGLPIVFTRHTNTSFSSENTQPWQLGDGLDVKMDDMIINKTKSSIFGEKSFQKYLADKDFQWMFVAGLVSNGCVQGACVDGIKNGLKVVLAEDGHSTFHKEQGDMVHKWNEALADQGVMVVPTEAIVSS